MLKINPTATYNGYSWPEALQAGYAMRRFGLTDDEINDIIEKAEDKENNNC